MNSWCQPFDPKTVSAEPSVTSKLKLSNNRAGTRTRDHYFEARDDLIRAVIRVTTDP